MTNDLTGIYDAHVAELIRRMNAGDEFAQTTVGAMALLISGWRPGDPDPTGGPGGGGGEKVVDLSAWVARLAA